LIELVVSLVLASLMMVALLRIVAIVARETNQLRGEQTDHVAAGVLADRLRNDLINARGIVADAGSITLSGVSTRTNRPGKVLYQVVTGGGTPVLVRREGNQSELCWFGFGRFAFESYESIDAETPVPELTDGLPPAPSRFRISVSDWQGRRLLSEVIAHHVD
jgi:hypothetical protein